MPCVVCGAVTSDPLELPRRISVCRACADDIGRVLDESTDAALIAGLWGSVPTVPRRELDDNERIFKDFKARVNATLSREDYAEMGLAVDAIQEASVALNRRAPKSIAERALALLFGENARR